jgi:TatD DNase family protein
MIDAHAHIHDSQFSNDRDAVVERAKSVGVKTILTIGTSISESLEAVAIAKKYRGMVWASIGVHPHEYATLPSKTTQHTWLSQLKNLTNEPEVVAIGECGLDYHSFDGKVVSSEVKASQQTGFREQLRLAIRVNKPVIVHMRESYDDVADVLQEELSREVIPVVLHCYQGNARETERFLKDFKRVVFSFAGNSTYPVKQSLRGTKDDPKNVMAMVPIDRLLIETDCPYLSPQSKRGERNEPSFIMETAREIARIQNISLEDLEKIVGDTFEKTFLCCKE